MHCSIFYYYSVYYFFTLSLGEIKSHIDILHLFCVILLNLELKAVIKQSRKYIKSLHGPELYGNEKQCICIKNYMYNSVLYQQ